MPTSCQAKLPMEYGAPVPAGVAGATEVAAALDDGPAGVSAGATGDPVEPAPGPAIRTPTVIASVAAITRPASPRPAHRRAPKTARTRTRSRSGPAETTVAGRRRSASGADGRGAAAKKARTRRPNSSFFIVPTPLVRVRDASAGRPPAAAI